MKYEHEVLLFTSIAEYEARRDFVRHLTLVAGDIDRIVGKYELPSDKAAWAKCGVNNCNTPHRFGFVIRKKDGQETNIGHECGERETGESFRDVVATFRRAEDAQARKRTAQTLVEDKANLISRAELAAKAGREQAVRLRAFLDTFKPLKSFWRALTTSAKQGGVIRAALQADKNWNLSIGRKEQLVTIGRFDGGVVLINDGLGLPVLVERLVLPWLEDLSQEGLEVLDRRALGEMVKDAGSKRDLLERAEHFVEASQRFLNADNVAGLEVICDDVLRAGDASTARQFLRAWVDEARTAGIPVAKIRLKGGKART